MRQIPLNTFYEDFNKRLKLSAVTADISAEKRFISSTAINKPGLALTGYFNHFLFDAVQVLSLSEVEYINHQCQIGNIQILERLCSYEIPCFVNVSGALLSDKFINLCRVSQIPIYKSTYSLLPFFRHLSEILEACFAQTTMIHGTLVDVYGTGLLIMGRSGIGKSEIALDLIERGHRLVTDDVVSVIKRSDNILIGKGLNKFNPFMEIRGVGVINVKELFGTRAIRMQKRIEVVVNLEDWDSNTEYERLGLDDDIMHIHGVQIPRVKLPIFPGKNITVIAEAIALNLHLKVYGYNAAAEFNKMNMKRMRENKNTRLTNYLIYDNE